MFTMCMPPSYTPPYSAHYPPLLYIPYYSRHLPHSPPSPLLVHLQEEVLKYDNICETALSNAKQETAIHNRNWLDSPWTGFFEKQDAMVLQKTGIEESTLNHIGDVFSTPPGDGFTLHGGLKRILKARKEMVAKREADWALGEAFTFGSLLKDGVHVRLSGQDVERGTFRLLLFIFSADCLPYFSSW